MLGLVGIQGLSIYRLIPPLYQVPVEPVLDLVPGITPFRVTSDVVQASSMPSEYRVTRKRMQDFSDVTTHVQSMPRMLQADVLLAAGGLNLSLPGLPTFPNTGLVRLARLDLMRFAYLDQMAQRREPVLALTPQFSLTGFIEALTPQWGNVDGWSLRVGITIVEARIVGPSLAGQVPDVDALATGGNAGSQAGTSSGTSSVSVEPTSPAGPGVSPLAPI